MTECVVCESEIEQEVIGLEAGYGGESYAPAETEHAGEIYYFCRSEHRESFESDPDQYVSS